MRETIALKCTECGDVNYTITKNKKLHPGKVEIKKYCKRLKKHTIHKESRDTIRS